MLILLQEVCFVRKVRESIPRQIDKKSRVPEEEKGVWALKKDTVVWNSQGGGKGKLFFFPLYVS